MSTLYICADFLGKDEKHPECGQYHSTVGEAEKCSAVHNIPAALARRGVRTTLAVDDGGVRKLSPDELKEVTASIAERRRAASAPWTEGGTITQEELAAATTDRVRAVRAYEYNKRWADMTTEEFAASLPMAAMRLAVADAEVNLAQPTATERRAASIHTFACFKAIGAAPSIASIVAAAPTGMSIASIRYSYAVLTFPMRQTTPKQRWEADVAAVRSKRDAPRFTLVVQPDGTEWLRSSCKHPDLFYAEVLHTSDPTFRWRLMTDTLTSQEMALRGYTPVESVR